MTVARLRAIAEVFELWIEIHTTTYLNFILDLLGIGKQNLILIAITLTWCLPLLASTSSICICMR